MKSGIHSRVLLAGEALLSCLMGASSLAAQQTASPPVAADAQTYAVILSGIGGDPDYEKIIDGWGKDLHNTLSASGLGKENVFWLAGKKQEGAYGESRKDQVTKLIATLAARLRPQDVFELFLIGHGSYDDYDYRFNMPGLDLTAREIAGLLEPVKASRQLIVNMTSASGGSVPDLRRKGRALITSTTAGQERNFSVFARYFVAGVQDTAADADKNEAISALEAFRYAARETTRYYESAKRLATEHSLIEDKGDSEGAREANVENGQGLLAGAISVRRLGQASAALETPEIRQLRARKRGIEESIEQLKYGKASMESKVYMRQLEKLLVELSRTQAELDQLEQKAAAGAK